MSFSSFNKSGGILSNEEVVIICRALKQNNIKLLCIRECEIGEKDLHRIIKLTGTCSSIQQLTLNIGIVSNYHHVELLAQSIRKNKSLTGLHIHGSEIGDVGMQVLGRAINSHPGIVSLDIGDCKLGDMAVDVIYSLLLPMNNRPGITELTLSSNPRISALGWAQLGMCLSNCSTLRWLFLDYNPLGDYGASCLLVGLAASQSVQILDMEACGLTEHTGQVILHLVQNHMGGLSRVKLSQNRLRKSTVEAIKKHLMENNLDESETGSSVTVDDLFSLNSSRISSCTTTRSRSSSKSSSSSSSSSSSDSDSSSNEDKTTKKKKNKDKSKNRTKDKVNDKAERAEGDDSHSKDKKDKKDGTDEDTTDEDKGQDSKEKKCEEEENEDDTKCKKRNGKSKKNKEVDSEKEEDESEKKKKKKHKKKNKSDKEPEDKNSIQKDDDLKVNKRQKKEKGQKI